MDEVLLTALITDGVTEFHLDSRKATLKTALVNIKFERCPILDEVEIYRVRFAF